MWHYHPDVHVLTVLPEKAEEVETNDHYDALFTQSGAEYYFVDETDPYLNIKIRRGRQDICTAIPHQHIESTTDRVMRLFDDMVEDNLLFSWHRRKLPSINDSLFEC